MNIQTKKEYFNEVLRLESGRILSEFELVYETYGERASDDSNIIVICHALTGSHHAAGKYDESEPKPGWWDALIGDGKCIDTSKYFVICVDILGSPFGSTSPLSIEPNKNAQYRLRFPVLAISDVVNAQMRLFKRLGIKKVRAIIGGSLGGMQALCFAIEHPDFARNVVSMASTYATQPWAIAFNKIAMHAIKNDPEFKDGYYDEEQVAKNGLLGLEVGRIAGHISFLAPASMERKFARRYVGTDGLYELFGRYEVDRYMEYNGANFAKRFDPLCYLYTIKMMNNFDTTRHYGSLTAALSKVRSQLTLLSFSGDMLFFPSEMKAIADELKALGKEHYYEEIESDYGHDAFLVEIPKIENHIRKAIQ